MDEDEVDDDYTDPGYFPFADEAELERARTIGPMMPLPFPPWYPKRNEQHRTLLSVRPLYAFIPARLIISAQGGKFRVTLSKEPNESDWIDSSVFNVAAFGTELIFKPLTPDDTMHLAVRWTPPPETALWRRLLARVCFWRPRAFWMERPMFQALMLGRVVR